MLWGKNGISLYLLVRQKFEVGLMASCAEDLGDHKDSRLKDIYDLREPYELEVAVPKQSAVG